MWACRLTGSQAPDSKNWQILFYLSESPDAGYRNSELGCCAVRETLSKGGQEGDWNSGGQRCLASATRGEWVWINA